MGICWGSPSSDPKQPYPVSHSYGYRGGFSMTSGFNSYSKFSVTVSRSLDDKINWDDGEVLASPYLKDYSFADLKKATRNFSSDNLVGEGGFGQVFKGWVDEQMLAPSEFGKARIVAIKKLHLEGFQEWQMELNILGRLSHPNLVELLGYCWEETELLLVYAFMQKGSLEDQLFRRSAEPLSWSIRLKIVIDAARGLAFLHASQVIHRDCKTSNILLNENYNAKIADFGLAKLRASDGETHVTTQVVGTMGYVAPEYVMTGQLYAKSDVYGFGVVLLEVLTGKQLYDRTRPSAQQYLTEWAEPYLAKKGKLAKIIDKRIEGQYSSKGALHFAQLVLKCLCSEPESRPSMEEVVEALEKIDEMKERPIE